MNKIYLLLILIIVFIFSACNMPRKTEPNEISALLAQTQTAIAIELFIKNTPSPTATVFTLTEEAGITETIQASPSTVISTPSPLPIGDECTNLAKFINETYPDNSKFPPNERFVKSWVLQNVGTCTWTPEYQLVFQEGDEMGGTSPVPIGQTVNPDDSIEINLPQNTPGEPGVYQGFWKLRSEDNVEFGLGDDGSVSFWVKIIVEGKPQNTPSGTFQFKSPTWSQNFNQGTSLFPIGSDSDTIFEIINNQLRMTALTISGDQWRVANGFVDNFAFEIIFNTLNPCSDKNSYGMIVRAPDQPDGIIDTGYVFTFSCDGNYRIYRLDNGNFNGIVNWTPNQNIKKGADKSNSMGIIVKGNMFQLFANGVLIYEFEDSAYSSGLYGTSIRKTAEDNFSIGVQQISYWNLNQ
jgi:hypothetical protein